MSTQLLYTIIGVLGILCLLFIYLWISAEWEINRHIIIYYRQPRARRQTQQRSFIRRVLRSMVAPSSDSAKSIAHN